MIIYLLPRLVLSSYSAVKISQQRLESQPQSQPLQVESLKRAAALSLELLDGSLVLRVEAEDGPVAFRSEEDKPNSIWASSVQIEELLVFGPGKYSRCQSIPEVMPLLLALGCRYFKPSTLSLS